MLCHPVHYWGVLKGHSNFFLILGKVELSRFGHVRRRRDGEYIKKILMELPCKKNKGRRKKKCIDVVRAYMWAVIAAGEVAGGFRGFGKMETDDNVATPA